ncbi:hypothetical protein DKM44_00360 [Deinococcus irradiatisoli]|uniref:Uncharacterized protein n=1 Tax=Deinococcus irradiatisoli TaxID=2202254 RepID=A0A2Z3JIT5_9DEIO|nr:hypothetical protein [Deinococcus irradiatisoli]AWN21878.1 hypothetical protein DKM44_00360 [Deinococcus irradiatisoli]
MLKISTADTVQAHFWRTFVPDIYLLVADLVLLVVIAALLYSSGRRLHYRDAPFLFPERWLLWASLSVAVHGALVAAAIWTLWLERLSALWWLALVLGAVPVATALRYALGVNASPRRVAERNKRRHKSSGLPS